MNRRPDLVEQNEIRERQERSWRLVLVRRLTEREAAGCWALITGLRAWRFAGRWSRVGVPAILPRTIAEPCGKSARAGVPFDALRARLTPALIEHRNEFSEAYQEMEGE